jgi:hypothetical protein
VPAARLDEFESRLGLALPGSFRLLYGWRDGQEATCSDPLQGNFRFMPLAEVADSKDLLDGMVGADFEDPRWWRPAQDGDPRNLQPRSARIAGSSALGRALWKATPFIRSFKSVEPGRPGGLPTW